MRWRAYDCCSNHLHDSKCHDKCYSKPRRTFLVLSLRIVTVPSLWAWHCYTQNLSPAKRGTLWLDVSLHHWLWKLPKGQQEGAAYLAGTPPFWMWRLSAEQQTAFWTHVCIYFNERKWTHCWIQNYIGYIIMHTSDEDKFKAEFVAYPFDLADKRFSTSLELPVAWMACF